MAGKALEATAIKFLLALRDPIIIFNAVTLWMTFAILNRPAVAMTVDEATTAKEADGFIWTTTLIMSIFFTLLSGLVVMKYVVP